MQIRVHFSRRIAATLPHSALFCDTCDNSLWSLIENGASKWIFSFPLPVSPPLRAVHSDVLFIFSVLPACPPPFFLRLVQGCYTNGELLNRCADMCVCMGGNSGIPKWKGLVNVLRDHFSQWCQFGDSHRIRLINEIIDHFMELIIDTLSCCSPPPFCSHHHPSLFL